MARTTDVSIYVSKTGDDANDGLTSSTPVLTVGRAQAVAAGISTIGDLTFYFSAGDWGDVTLFNNISATSIRFRPIDTNNKPTFNYVQAFSVRFIAYDCIFNYLAVKDYSSSGLRRCSVGLVQCLRGGLVEVTESIDIIPYSSSYIFQVSSSSSVIIDSNTVVTFGSNLTQSIFVNARSNSCFNIYTQVTFAGTFTGQKYSFTDSPVIVKGITPDNYPGSIAGTGNYIIDGIPSVITPLAKTLSIATPTGDDVAAAHNCVYRGDDLTSRYTLDQLSAKLANGDFSDLYIGDYITYPFTYNNTTTNVNFRIAHFNYWKYMGHVDNAGLKVDGTAKNSFGQTTTNHIVFIPDTYLFTSKMNPEDDTTGGLRWSYLWQLLNRTDNAQKFTNKDGTATDSTDSCVYTALNAANCMNGHILGHSDILSTSVNRDAMSAAGAGWTGSSNNWKWCDEYLGLCSEAMVYGGKVWGSSGYDVGCKKSQLALFRIDPTWINGRASRYTWWLGSVTSGAYFAHAVGTGVAGGNRATYVTGVRPYLLFA